MNKTPNYSLNQWDPTDRILMEDFNADNAQIEAALDGKLGRSRLIRQVTVEKNAQSVYVDLSDVDWNDWEYVVVTYTITQQTDTNAYIICALKDRDKRAIQAASSAPDASSNISRHLPGPFFMALLPRHDSANPIQAICVAETSSFGYSATSFAELAFLQFVQSSIFIAGTTFTVWGVK